MTSDNFKKLILDKKNRNMCIRALSLAWFASFDSQDLEDMLMDFQAGLVDLKSFDSCSDAELIIFAETYLH